MLYPLSYEGVVDVEDYPEDGVERLSRLPPEPIGVVTASDRDGVATADTEEPPWVAAPTGARAPRRDDGAVGLYRHAPRRVELGLRRRW